MPKDRVSDLFILLMDDDNFNTYDLTAFTDYFLNTWLEGDFPLYLWNHWDNHGSRTNNNIEGYNFRINKILITLNPNIWKYIGLLQLEEMNMQLAKKRID